MKRIKFKNWHNTNGLVSGILRLRGLTIVNKEKKPRYIDPKQNYIRIECPECEGRMYFISRPSDASTVKSCLSCDGSGKVDIKQCQFCSMTASWCRKIRISNKKFVKYYLCSKHKDREDKEFIGGTINKVKI